MVQTTTNVPLAVAACAAAVVGALLGVGMDRLVFRRARRAGVDSGGMLVVSLGLYVVLENVLLLLFSTDVRTIRYGWLSARLEFHGCVLTQGQVVIVISAAVLVATVWAGLRLLPIGIIYRGICCDASLAETYGVRTSRARETIFAVGSAFAGVAGVLLSLDADVTPFMGLNALMMGVVAMIVGGDGRVLGTATGGLLLGLAQHLGVWRLGTQWQEAIAFAVLVLFLLFKPVERRRIS